MGEGGADGAGPSSSSGALDGLQQHQQFLGDASGVIPNFGHISLGSEQLPDGLGLDHVEYFEEIYKKHCEVSLSKICTQIS